MDAPPRILGLFPRHASQRNGSLARALPGWALIVLLAAAFLMGGGARGDILSLVVLRPLSFALLAVGLATLSAEHVRGNAGAFAIAGGMVSLAALHLFPLPPGVWHSLPGRDLLTEVDRLTGLGDVARPLTMNPVAGWNALFALAAPAAALVLAVQTGSDGRRRLRHVLIGIGTVSAVLGLLQAIGPAKGPLYLYRITNPSSPVGLFANRNHHALFLASLLPLVALMAISGKVPARGRADRRPAWLAGALVAGAVFVSVVVASGSRAGLAAAATSLALLPFVLGVSYAEGWRWLAYRAPAKRAAAPPWRLIAALALAAAMTTLFVTAGRETGFERFAGEDDRGPSWRLIVGLVSDYMPWGSGLGSFVEVFQVTEPDWRLRPTYLNHAHNDLLEVALTLGVPGLVLVAAATIGFTVAGVRLIARRRDPALREARAALVALFLLAAGSLVDYPLRTPALACLFAALVPWLRHRSNSDERRDVADRSGR